MRTKQPAEKLVLDTVERPTGRTYNGRLTYMKAIPISGLSAGSNFFPHGITDLDDIVEIGGSLKDGSGSRVPF